MYLINNNLSVILFLMSGFLFSCRTTPHSHAESPKSLAFSADEIVFEYHDASVPPDDHRSYRIKIHEDKLYYVVDSYGEIIKEDSISIEKNKWNNIQSAFLTCDIRNVEKRKNSEGCTGGSGNSIYLYDNQEKLFAGYQYRCSTFFDGDLDGDLNCFLKIIRSGIDPTFFSTD